MGAVGQVEHLAVQEEEGVIYEDKRIDNIS